MSNSLNFLYLSGMHTIVEFPKSNDIDNWNLLKKYESLIKYTIHK